MAYLDRRASKQATAGLSGSGGAGGSRKTRKTQRDGGEGERDDDHYCSFIVYFRSFGCHALAVSPLREQCISNIGRNKYVCKQEGNLVEAFGFMCSPPP